MAYVATDFRKQIPSLCAEVRKKFDHLQYTEKIGSAQTDVQGKTNAWFVGFAPFDDPEIAIVVFVRNGGHGSYTAEVARDIIAQYFGMNTNQVTENTTAIPTVQIIN